MAIRRRRCVAEGIWQGKLWRTLGDIEPTRESRGWL
jgi:hypothetical protein